VVERKYSEPGGATETRPCCCNSGWVTIGQIVLDPETGEEEEEFARYPCRNESSACEACKAGRES
jgi:hypothetical protein